MTCDLIDTRTCLSIIKRYGERDNAEDIELVRYYIDENALIIKLKYRGVELKARIDKLDFVDGKVEGATNVQEFADTYLAPLGKHALQIMGEEEEEPTKIQLSLSQV